MAGWIKLHRKLLENAIFYKPDYFQVWAYILLKVNHEEADFIWNNERKIIKKGSGIFSQKKMSEELKFDISKINRILNYLKNENQITFIGHNKYTEIHVVNWIEYQEALENGNQKETKNKTETNQEENKKKPEANQKQTNKNDKKEKNNKNEENVKKESAVILPFESNEFKDAWGRWMDYRKKRKFPYSSEISEQVGLKNLFKISKNNEQTAIEIIDQSIGNDWQGLFELKNNSGSKQSSAGGKITQQFQLNKEQHARNEQRYGNTENK